MLGKAKCKILKQIRQKIADENDIPYVTRECTYQGSCSGTCPKCEAELQELERQLALRQKLGKAVTVTALCAGMAVFAAGCTPKDSSNPGDTPTADSNEGTQIIEVEDNVPPIPDDDEMLGDPVVAECDLNEYMDAASEGDIACEP